MSIALFDARAPLCSPQSAQVFTETVRDVMQSQTPLKLADRDQKDGAKGVVISRHDAPDAAWVKDWPGSLAAAGNVPKLLAGALQRYPHARGSVILATHVGLAPLARSLKALSGGRFLMFLHGVEAWGPLPRATRWGLRACDLFVANSRFTLDKFYRDRSPSMSSRR